MSDKSILKIEQALIAKIVKKHDVLGMIVTQNRHARLLSGQKALNDRLPGIGISGFVYRDRSCGSIPLDKQPCLALLLAERIFGEWACRDFVKPHEGVHRPLVDILFVLRVSVQIIPHARHAEVLKQD